MKATITLELEDGGTKLAERLTAEAPTASMLKMSVARTALMQMPELIKHIFERKELEDAKREEAVAGTKVKALPAAKQDPVPGKRARPGKPTQA